MQALSFFTGIFSGAAALSVAVFAFGPPAIKEVLIPSTIPSFELKELFSTVSNEIASWDVGQFQWPSGAEIKTNPATAPPSKPAKYDISGIKLGMSKADIRSAVSFCAHTWEKRIEGIGDQWTCVDAASKDEFRFGFSLKDRLFEVYLTRTQPTMTIDEFYLQVGTKYPTASRARCSTHSMIGDNCFPLPDGSVLGVGWIGEGRFQLGLRGEAILVEDNDLHAPQF
jgi:hypothetical protein